jgi:hypothetical protein
MTILFIGINLPLPLPVGQKGEAFYMFEDSVAMRIDWILFQTEMAR